MARRGTACLLLAASTFAGVTSARSRGSLSNVATRESQLEDAWSKELDTKLSPVQRVVSLLQKMKGELEKEARSETEMYDKMVCWCETNEKEKTKAVADADSKTNDLQAEIEERAAQFGKLSTEIAALKKQIAEDKASLKKATAIRETEAAAFSEDEKAEIQAITNLKNAIDVLARHNGGAALMQGSHAPLLASVRAVLRDVSLRYDLMLGDKPLGAERGGAGAAFLSMQHKDLSTSLRNVLGQGTSVMPARLAEHALAHAASDATKGGSGAFVQAPGYQSYSSRSSGIFGILSQMKEEFEADLSQKQKDEMKAVADFKALAASKRLQIETAQQKLDTVEGGFADNQKALSDAKEDLALTRERRTSDVAFLTNLKLQCKDFDSQWEQRSHTRSQEIKAVSEALAVLTEDDARDLMSKTVTLLQERIAQNANLGARLLRKRAAALLRAAASGSPVDDDDLLSAWHGMRAVGSSPGPARAQLSNLAVSVELDNFTKVKQVMDKMIADLKEQQQAEVNRKAYCVKELNQNEKDTFAKSEEKKDLEDEIESLAATMDKLQEEIAGANAEIAHTKVAIKSGSAVRETENAEFQAVVADQRATQEILQKALARLELFYKKNVAAAKLAGLVQQEPPVKFNGYKRNAGSSPVIGLLEQIIEDSKALEAEATTDESKAQAAYEEFVKNSNSVIADAQAAVASKSGAKAAARMESEQASSDHTSATGELESLGAYASDLQGQCDFLLKNFPIRQRARLQEIEAIQGAKSILSGAA